MAEKSLSDRLLRVAMSGYVGDDDPTVIADAQARIDALESTLREVKAMTPSHYAREHAIIDEALTPKGMETET